MFAINTGRGLGTDIVLRIALVFECRTVATVALYELGDNEAIFIEIIYYCGGLTTLCDLFMKIKNKEPHLANI